jgi:hypothetical protein
MKILLDECVTKKVKTVLSDVVPETLNSNFNTIKEFLPEFVERMKTLKKGHTYRINH